MEVFSKGIPVPQVIFCIPLFKLIVLPLVSTDPLKLGEKPFNNELNGWGGRVSEGVDAFLRFFFFFFFSGGFGRFVCGSDSVVL